MENIYKLSKTIDDFRSFFAPSEERESANICSVINSIQNMVKSQFEDMNIDLQFTSTGRLIENTEDCQLEKFNLDVYPDIMKQVMMNCLQNSKEAVLLRMEAGEIDRGKVSIDIKRPNGEIVIRIIDNGGGVPEGLLGKVFDPYFTTKDESIGIGLGLYISKNILEEHMAGTITLENIEEGAVVTLRFKASGTV